jgi:hypothetical protein
MLASLLPGLRDLRTPLAVGYLWLVALWLLLHSHIPTSIAGASGPLRSLYELGSLVGNAAVLTALSFISYLLGSLLLVRISPRAYVFYGRRSIEPAPIPTSNAGIVSVIFGSHRGESLYTQLRTFVEARLREEAEDLGRSMSHYEESQVLGEEIEYIQEIAIDLDAVSIQLQAKNRDLWDTHDRYTAEAQFRLGIAVPLAAIIVISAIQSTLFWLFLIIVPLWLSILSYRLSFEAISTLVQAVILKIVEPPAVVRHRERIARLRAQADKEAEAQARYELSRHNLETSEREDREEKSKPAIPRGEQEPTQEA